MKTPLSLSFICFVAFFVNGCFIAVAPSVSSNSAMIAPLFDIDLDSDANKEHNQAIKQQEKKKKQQHSQLLAYNHLLAGSPYAGGAEGESQYYFEISMLMPKYGSYNIGGRTTVSKKHIIDIDAEYLASFVSGDALLSTLVMQYKYPYDLSLLPGFHNIVNSLALDNIQAMLGLQYSYTYSLDSGHAIDTISLVANLGAKQDNLYAHLELIGIPSNFTLTGSFLAFLTPRNKLGIETVYYSHSNNAYLSPHYSFITKGGKIWQIARYVSSEFDIENSPFFVQFVMVK